MSSLQMYPPFHFDLGAVTACTKFRHCISVVLPLTAYWYTPRLFMIVGAYRQYTTFMNTMYIRGFIKIGR